VESGRFIILDEGRGHEVPVELSPPAEVWLRPEAVREATGWELGDRGLCRGETCIPLRAASAPDERGVELSALAGALGRPLALDVAERIASLGASAAARADRLRSLEAPDLTLPDLQGRHHILSGFRGRKVLLIAWASW